MLVVALLPVAIFSAVVAADLGSVSRTTVDSANRAILDDAEHNQQSLLGSRAQSVGNLLDNASSQLRGLHDTMVGTLGGTTAAGEVGTALPAMSTTGGVAWVEDHSPGGVTASTVMVGGAASVTAAERIRAVASAYRQTTAVEPAMETIRGSNRAIRSVWVADYDTNLVRVLPAMSVPEAVRSGRIASDSPLGALGDAAFSGISLHPGDAASGVSWDGEPAAPSAQDAQRPVFSVTYPTGEPGVVAMTVSMPVGSGSHYRVGIDLDVRALIGDTVSTPASDQRGAYNILLDSSGRLLGGGDQVASDFVLPAGAEWGQMLVPVDPALRAQLGDVLGRGSSRTIDTSIGGHRRLLLTAPLAGAHWVLASVVPLEGLLPDQPGLSNGIGNGIGRILRDAVIAAVGLSMVAFVLASLLARRVVAPVRALTVAAERLGAGEMDVPIPATGRDEVGLLAVSLERMRREVNASRDGILAAARELEGRVEERTTELRERNEELVALNTLAGSLTRSLDPEAILEGALDTLRVVVPLRAGRAFVVNEERLEARASWAAGGEQPTGADADQLAAAARDAVDSHDLALHSAADGVLVGIPLETRDGALGAIGLLTRPGWRMGGRSRALIRAVGDQVGLALRTAALSAEGRELAVLEERTRLAREIHDTIAQQLTAIVLQLEAAEALVTRDASRARSIVVSAREQARSALSEARQSVWNLRPTPLDRRGLAGAITMEAIAWERRTGIRTTVHTEELPRSASLPPQTEVALFRIFQEALTNAARHSGAGAVDVRLEMDGEGLRLAIRDDGGGFATAGAERPGSFGLVGMEERARLIGGALAIDSAPGAGTEISVRLPLGQLVGRWPQP